MIAPLKFHTKRHPRPTNYRLFQFKISLQEITPTIWRRIQVPETYSFWDLHVAIQDSMGWEDSHLHAFHIKNPKTGKEANIQIDPETYDESTEGELVCWREYIGDYFSETNPHATYEYDFGDGWKHDIEFEGIFPKIPKLKYPKCIAGERNCPPEDCGGIGGYEDLVAAMKNPKHPQRKELIEWLGFKYDPDKFSLDVRFDNPRERWERAFK